MKAKLDVKGIKGMERDRDVLAVIFFGSYVRGGPHRDIDVCVVLREQFPRDQMTTKKLKYLALLPATYDIQIFQQLPLYIRARVFKEGKILFCRDQDALFSIAYQTIKEYEYFAGHYQTYLEGVKHG